MSKFSTAAPGKMSSSSIINTLFSKYIDRNTKIFKGDNIMKKHFQGFYGQSKESVDLAYKDSNTLFIFDTNILLSLYRCEEKTRDEFIDIWRKLKNQVWLPFHVCLEYQRNRLTTIQDARNSLKKISTTVNKGINDIFPKLENGTISRYSQLKDEINNLKSNLNKLLEEFENGEIETRRNKINFINEHDIIRDLIDELSIDRIGPEPIQSDIDSINKEGGVRYKYETAPGFSDAKKKKETRFSYNNVNYDAQFSDLYIWKQILQHVKTNDIKKVIYVSNDEKVDFYFEINGKTRGPVESLVTEIRREADVDIFLLHKIESFLHHAVISLNANINEKSILELASAATEYHDDKNHTLRITTRENYYDIPFSKFPRLKIDYDDISKDFMVGKLEELNNTKNLIENQRLEYEKALKYLYADLSSPINQREQENIEFAIEDIEIRIGALSKHLSEISLIIDKYIKNMVLNKPKN